MASPAKVIIVGAAWYGDWAKGFYMACKRLGLNAEIVYNNSLPAPLGGSAHRVTSLFERSKRIAIRLSPALFRFLKKWRRRLAEREILIRVGIPQPGERVLVIFIWTPGSEWVLKKLRSQAGIILVLWQGEPIVRDSSWESLFDYFNHTFIVDDGIWLAELSEYNRQRTRLLPLSSDESIFYTLSSPVPEKYRCELSFIGKFIPKRAETLSIFKDKDIKIYGYDWEKGYTQFPWLLGKCFGPISTEEANLVYNGSKIVMGTLGGPKDHLIKKDPYTTTTMRTFDIALAGAFQVCERVALTQRIFGDSIKMYDSPEELRELVEYYLTNSDERRMLAKKAHEIAQGHSYTARAKEILRVVGFQ